MISALLPNYARADLAFERGEGAWLWTTDGRRFLDFGSGIATASLGHGHPHLAKAIAEQAAKVMHVSNLYRIPQAERLAQRLVDLTFADSVFFCNSGAEANEGMIKMMRRAMFDAGKPEAIRFITFEGAFHGRTLATLAATGNAAYLKGFGPPVEGFDQVPFNNMNAVRDKISAQTCGIIVEPIQGEGGVRPADMQFLKDLRAVCDEYGIILGMDEVQSGMGRTGKLFAVEHWGVEPDILCLAKGIASGMPLGAIIARGEVMDWPPGSHASTFGGNPVSCRAALTTLDLLENKYIRNAAERGEQLREGLLQMRKKHPALGDVRGLGLMMAVDLVKDRGTLDPALRDEIVQTAYRRGLLLLGCGDAAIRFCPPLCVTAEQVNTALRIIESVLTARQPQPAAV